MFRRFRVVERGTKDGYNTAVVEFLKDEIPSGQELEGRRQYFY
jgi:Lon protease-like protein